MRRIALILLALCLCAQARAQTEVDPVTLSPVIAGSSYKSVNQATYTTTATGLLAVYQPAALTGSGPLKGVSDGLVIEVPEFVFQQSTTQNSQSSQVNTMSVNLGSSAYRLVSQATYTRTAAGLMVNINPSNIYSLSQPAGAQNNDSYSDSFLIPNSVITPLFQ